MIFLDRLVRIIRGDIQLPIKCYASDKDLINPCLSCNCKVFCRQLKKGKPALVYLDVKQRMRK